MYTAIRTHEFEMAHRLVGHCGACANIHGHSYKLEIEVGMRSSLPSFDISRTIEGNHYAYQVYPPQEPVLNDLGMVLDFGDIKRLLCSWIDENWDHKLMLFNQDPLITNNISGVFQAAGIDKAIVIVPFNPTAENMARYLVNDVFPKQLTNMPAVQVTAVTLYETSKCKVRVTKGK